MLRGAILYDHQGLTRTLSIGDGSLSTTAIKWRDMTSISVFKRDLFSYDLICMVIRTGTVELEFDEEMDGWESAIEALPKYLPGASSPAEWWDKVVHPAFALSETLLFEAG